jgi:hypothetical protein
MNIPDTFNFSLIPLFNSNENNMWINPSNESEKLFSFVVPEDTFYITLSKSSLTSTKDTFTISSNNPVMIPDNQFSIANIKIRLNRNLSNYFRLTYISVLTEGTLFKSFIVKSEDTNYYYINFDNKIKIDTNTPLLELFKFTIEPSKSDDADGFDQYNIINDLKNVELITIEYSGNYIDPNDPGEPFALPGESGVNTSASIYSNKNILDNLPNYRINILEYQRKITIFENNQSSLGINKYNQMSIFRITDVNYSYITMNYFKEIEIEIPAKVRTYTLGKGILYNVNVTANKKAVSYLIPEIKTAGGEFTTYKTKNDQERIQTFYVDVEPDYVDNLPNRRSKRIFIVSGIDVDNNNLLSNLIFYDSNPVVF